MKSMTVGLDGVREDGRTFSIPVTVLFSARKTLGLEVKADGTAIARMPGKVGRETALQFIEKHKTWIIAKWMQAEERRLHEESRELKDYEKDPDKKAVYREMARRKITERTEYFARQMGISWKRIFIKETKTRWGSCSQAGNLNFNWKLVLMPPEILDYVVVHELAHRKEMNHSPLFWKEVAAVLPDYRERRAWLREHGRDY